MDRQISKTQISNTGISRCKPGDIWELGCHRLACLDSTEPETLSCLFGDKLADVRMVFADPPYGIGIINKRGRIGKSSLKYTPVIGDTSTATAIQAYQLCINLWPGAVQIWWGANYYSDVVTPSRCWLI